MKYRRKCAFFFIQPGVSDVKRGCAALTDRTEPPEHRRLEWWRLTARAVRTFFFSSETRACDGLSAVTDDV